MAQKNYFNSIIRTLKDLKKEHPNQEVSNHISGALADYQDIWGVSDKEFDFALNKYRATLSLDKKDIDDAYIAKIIKDGQNLDTILDDEDEDAWLDDFGM